MLTENEAAELAALLKKMEWPVPPNVFYALAGTTVFAGVDLALITEQKEVLLNRRPDSDPYFAGQWHLTGAVVMPGQTALSTIQNRVLKPDLGGFKLRRDPEFVMARDIMKGPPGPDSSPRGQEVYRLFQYLLTEEEKARVPVNADMQFYPLNAVPEKFMHHQRPSITKLRRLYGV